MKKYLILLITITSCSDIENPLPNKVKYKPINEFYTTTNPPSGISSIGNPFYIPIIKK